MENRRDEFLLEMYRQMFNDINRNITVVWQSVGVLVGAFAIFALVEKNILSADLASTIVILLCAWLFAHVVDSSYWYNRNLAIIANIERQFLNQADLRLIHYYFGAHRKNNKMITQLRIQVALGVGLALIILFYHFSTRVWEGLTAPLSHFEPGRLMPYLAAVACVFYCAYLVGDRRKAYAAFLSNSPGVSVNTSGINYGVGHSFGPTIWDGIRAFFGR